MVTLAEIEAQAMGQEKARIMELLRRKVVMVTAFFDADFFGKTQDSRCP